MKRIYLSKDQGIDSDYKYTVVCEKHNTMLGCSTKEIANRTKTSDFCEECK